MEKRRAQETVLHLNRLYSVISRTNRAIIHIRDRQALLDEACRIAVEEGKFLMAWIGLVDPVTREVRPVAASGYEAGYLSLLSITTDNVPQGMGLTGSCIRESRPLICNDIPSDSRMEDFRVEATRRGYCSSAAFPIRNGSTVVGAMRFYAAECNFFNDRELALLQELTDDLSFAFEMMERDLTLAELRRVSDALRLANRKLNLLNNIIRHDILNTITGLLGLEDMALSRLSDPEETGHLLSGIKDSTRRIQQQITFTRDYQNIGVHAPQWQNVHAVVLRAAASAACGPVTVSVMADEGFEVFADAMLEKVFYNLIDNALRYRENPLPDHLFCPIGGDGPHSHLCRQRHGDSRCGKGADLCLRLWEKYRAGPFLGPGDSRDLGDYDSRDRNARRGGLFLDHGTPVCLASCRGPVLRRCLPVAEKRTKKAVFLRARFPDREEAAR